MSKLAHTDEHSMTLIDQRSHIHNGNGDIVRDHWKWYRAHAAAELRDTKSHHISQWDWGRWARFDWSQPKATH